MTTQKQTQKLIQKQAVVAWAIIEKDADHWRGRNCPEVRTVPIVHITGIPDDCNFIEGDSELEDRHPLSFVPAQPGTWRITVHVPSASGRTEDIEVLGVKHPNDGTTDAWWEEKAREYLAARDSE